MYTKDGEDGMNTPNGAQSPVSSGNDFAWPVCFDALPASLEEMQALPMAAITEPQHTAALVVAALCAYPANKDAAIAMLNFLKGPTPLSPYEIQFLADRMRGKEYLPLSFFTGATPENNYSPALPYTVYIIETPHSRTQIAEGYLQLYIRSGGADAPRPVKLRSKESTGQWFLWEQMLLSDIRQPTAANPWA